MTREEYMLLFEKYLSGKATSDEIASIMAYQDDLDISGQGLDIVDAQDKARGERIESKLMDSITTPVYRNIYHKNKWLAAAAVILISFCGLLIYQDQHYPGPNKASNTSIVKNDVKAGANKALLTLANGRQIILEDLKEGTFVKKKGFTVTKQKKGVVQYVSTQVNSNVQLPVEYNTITTPIGGKYILILPDGTKVWLNAASSLRFPTAFNGRERLVELDGEGYFEVAKNKQMPFKINFNKQQVEVLGTHFNIKAYKDDEMSLTTLLEGSVKITKNNVKRILVPGQQAVSSNSKPDLDITEADTEEATAWKDGLFLFHNENIKNIMKQLARWYNVDVVYEGNLANREYGGRMSKSKNLSEILTNIQLTGTIHFKIDGRRVIVME